MMDNESHGDRLLIEIKSFWRISLHGDVFDSGEIDYLARWRSGGAVCVGEVELSSLII